MEEVLMAFPAFPITCTKSLHAKLRIQIEGPCKMEGLRLTVPKPLTTSRLNVVRWLGIGLLVGCVCDWKLASSFYARTNHFRAAWGLFQIQYQPFSESRSNFWLPGWFFLSSHCFLWWLRQDACVRAAFKTRGKTRRTASLQPEHECRMACCTCTVDDASIMNQLAETLQIPRDATYSTLSTGAWVECHQQYLHLNDGHLTISCISHGTNGYKIQAPEILLRSHHIASNRLAVLFWKSSSVDDTQPKEHSVFWTWHCPSHPWHEWTSAMLLPPTDVVHCEMKSSKHIGE